MAVGNGQRGTKRTRRQAIVADQPHPHAHPPLPPQTMPMTMPPMAHHLPYPPPPPPGAMMHPPHMPYPSMPFPPAHHPGMPPPPPPGALPPGYPTAVAPTPARRTTAAAAGAIGALNAATAARQVSPNIADAANGTSRRGSRGSRGGSSLTSSDGNSDTAGPSTNTSSTTNSSSSNNNNTLPMQPHLRAAYRTQTHACPDSCGLTSPSSTYTTHPGPQHLPPCPRHRHPATPAPSNHIPSNATAYTKLQSALTRELRDIRRRIEEDIERQRAEFMGRLERSKRRQLGMALEASRVANEALGRVPSVMAMNANVNMTNSNDGGMRQGGMAPQVQAHGPPVQMGVPMGMPMPMMMHPIPPPPPPMQEMQPMDPIPPPPPPTQQMEAPAEEEAMAEPIPPPPADTNHAPVDHEDESLLAPLAQDGHDEEEEDELIEPLPPAELTAHVPEPTHVGDNNDHVGNPLANDAVDDGDDDAAAVEAVDELIAEAGLDGDEAMGTTANAIGTAGQGGILQEGAEPQCVQHLVRSKKRRIRGSATGSSRSLGSNSEKGSTAAAAAANGDEAEEVVAAATTTTTVAGLAMPTEIPVAGAWVPTATAGPKCTQCRSSLVGGPPAAMCTSDKCRTMLCQTCLEEHKTTAPENSWCSDCGRVVNIVCRTCLEGKDSASTSATTGAGKNKLGSNEFLRCRSANCEQYCCPRHIRMMDCTVCGRQPFCHGHTRKCSTEGCDDCGRQLCGQMLCALKEGCVCGKRRHDPNVDWAITIMGEARKQEKARAALEAAEEEDPVENVPTQRKKPGGRRSKGNTKDVPAARNDGSNHDSDVLQANIHKIHEILTGGDNSNSNEVAAI